MTAPVLLVFIIIFCALLFDFINGFHDAANSIATVVSTRVLTPLVAVGWAAFFNFVAFAIMGTRVAKTIGGDMVHIELIPPDSRLYVLMAGILGAVVWNLITWYLALPTSSSHAIIGAYAGAAATAYGGFAGLLKPAAWIKTVTFIVASPVIGMTLAVILYIAVMWIFKSFTPTRVDKIFRRGQLLSAAAYSLGHGGNDAQKTMGIITAVLVAGGMLSSGPNSSLPPIPLWVVLSAHAAMGLGTLSGGWRIVRTMGGKITKLQPYGGFCAETAGAITLFGATMAGIPVSTTHTITGAIIGVGAARRFSAVRWGVTTSILWAWVLTIPCSATIAALIYLITLLITGR
jgi:PiT family inorganic phosphate transporter